MTHEKIDSYLAEYLCYEDEYLKLERARLSSEGRRLFISISGCGTIFICLLNNNNLIRNILLQCEFNKLVDCVMSITCLLLFLAILRLMYKAENFHSRIQTIDYALEKKRKQ